MDESKRNSLDIVLNGYYAEGHTAQVAHQMLVKLAGDKSCTLEEVEALYTKMDQEKQGGKLKVECITDFPEHLNKKIIEELDIPGRAALRKTCHLYRDFVEDIRCRIDSLEIKFDFDYVKVTVDHDFDVTYRKPKREHSNHIMKCSKGNRKLKGDFFDTALVMLKTILMNKKLHIYELDVHEGSNYGEYFEKLLDFLESVEIKLEVESLIADMDDLGGNNLCRLLKVLDVITIRKIGTGGSLAPSNFNHDVYELEQWKVTKRLEGYDLELNAVGVTNISHLETCYLNLRYESIKAELMMLLKDKLLLNPSLNQFKFIHDSANSENIEQLLNAIQPFKSSATSLWAYFDYPNSKEKLALSVTEDHIWFKGPCFVEEKAFWE